MSYLKRLFLLIFVVVACVGCDQTTKGYAERYLPASQSVQLFGNTVRLQVAHNHGAFLSLGANAPKSWRDAVLRSGIAVLLISLAIYAVGRPQSRSMTLALSLVIAGGTSNLIDRYVNEGYVIDFINIGWGALRTGIFNVADIALMAGLAMWIVQSWRRRTRHDDRTTSSMASTPRFEWRIAPRHRTQDKAPYVN